MEFPAGMDAETRDIINAALQGHLTPQQAKRAAAFDPVLDQFAWMAMTCRVAVLQTALGAAKATDPATPSGQIPIYTKPPARKRKGKPGARPGHKGTRRQPPVTCQIILSKIPKYIPQYH